MNGEEVFTATGEDFSSFAKGAYRHLELNYPKFFKMDKLSKLAFLGAEYLLMGYSGTEKEGEPASPAVFVYTLANICLGEIAIRHQLRSEGHFFVFDHYPEEFFIQYSQYLVQEGLAERVLCGWVELLGADYSLKFVIY